MNKFKNIGIDVIIDPTAQITHPELISIGDHVAIDQVYFSTSAEIGDYIHISPFVSIIGGKNSKLIMKPFSGISTGCRIVCGSDDFTEGLINPTVPIKYRKTKITTVTLEAFVTIGVNSVVMPGITLAEGSVIGANSVVTKNTEPWGIYVGSPAKKIKTRNKENILKYAKELGYKF